MPITIADVANFAPVDTLFAYLDPGSGSMVLQVVIAGLMSSLFFFRSSFGYLKARLMGARHGR